MTWAFLVFRGGRGGSSARSAGCAIPDAGRFRALAAGIGLPAIHQKSTFAFNTVKDGAERFLGTAKGGERPYARIYTRLGNPSSEYLERVLFRLEAQHVIDKALAADEREPTIGALVFSSGMGAISALIMATVKSGDAVLAGNVYGCTDSLLRNLSRFGVGAHFCLGAQFARTLAAVEPLLGLLGGVASRPDDLLDLVVVQTPS